MGASNSLPQSETINWKNLKTDQMSDIPKLYGISDEANRLIQKISVPILHTESSSSELGNIFLPKNQPVSYQASENFSSTSPFISSEMYKYVMNKYQQQNMVGGGNDLDNDSSTTATSSSSDSASASGSESISESSSSVKPAKKTHNAKGNTKKTKIVKKNKTAKKNTEAFLDYVSSSAHTGGSITDNSSVVNENNISVSSVRTSQINLISE